MVTPVLERLAASHAGQLKLVKVNVDENPDVATRYGAMSIPLIVLIDHGQEVDRHVGRRARATARRLDRPVAPGFGPRQATP